MTSASSNGAAQNRARGRVGQFLTAESGAITVDWTVLAASVVGLGVASVGAVRTGTNALGTDIQSSLTSASVAALSQVTNFSTPDLSQTGHIWPMSWGYDTDRNYSLGNWTRLNGGGHYQFITSPYAGVTSMTGGMMMDMSTNNNVALQNTLNLSAGESAFLSFNAADPYAGANGNGMDVYFGGQLVGSLTPGTRSMQTYSFELVGGSGDGTNRVELRSRQDSYAVMGVFVENIIVQ